MPDRRRFLVVAGAAAVGAALPSCSASSEPGGGGGGDGGGGGSTGSTSSVGGSGAGAGGASGCTSVPPGVPAGPLSDFASDGLHKVFGTTVLVGRDAGGLYALSSICTHKSCNLNSQGQVLASGVRCACHGAKFDAVGNVISGPAQSPLVAYAVATDCKGDVFVDTGSIVPNTQRLPA